MPGAEFNVDLLVYTRLITLGFVTFMLGFAWGFAKFILPRWLEAEVSLAGKLRLVQGLSKAA